MRPNLPLVAFVLLSAAGCYTVRPASVDGLHAVAAGAPPDGIDAETPIRFQRTGGSWTPWLTAGLLSVGDQGVMVHVWRSEWLDGATARHLGPRASAMLERVAPPNALVVRDREGKVRLTDDEPLDPWLARAAAERGAEGQSALDDLGRWELEPGPASVPGRELFAALAQPNPVALQFVDGLRWEDIVGVEIEQFDPLKTLGAVLISPVVLVAAVFVVCRTPTLPVGALGAAAGSSDPFDSNRVHLSDDRVGQGLLLLDDSSGSPDSRGMHRLFPAGAGGVEAGY